MGIEWMGIEWMGIEWMGIEWMEARLEQRGWVKARRRLFTC
jgi:hypothetical protein